MNKIQELKDAYKEFDEALINVKKSQDKALEVLTKLLEPDRGQLIENERLEGRCIGMPCSEEEFEEQVKTNKELMEGCGKPENHNGGEECVECKTIRANI